MKLSVMVVTVAALGGCARGSMLEQDQADAATGSPDAKGIDVAVNPMPDAPTGGGGTSSADARTLPMQGSTPASGRSTKRLVTEVGHETQSGGGNGITGDDETSEDTAATWDSTGFGNPTPGVVPAALQ